MVKKAIARPDPAPAAFEPPRDAARKPDPRKPDQGADLIHQLQIRLDRLERSRGNPDLDSDDLPDSDAKPERLRVGSVVHYYDARFHSTDPRAAIVLGFNGETFHVFVFGDPFADTAFGAFWRELNVPLQEGLGTVSRPALDAMGRFITRP